MLIGNANTKNEVEIKEIKNKLTIEFKIQKIKRMILLSFLLETNIPNNKNIKNKIV